MSLAQRSDKGCRDRFEAREQPHFDVVGLRHKLDAGIVRPIASDWHELHAANRQGTRKAGRGIFIHTLRSLRRENDVEALSAVENWHCLLADIEIAKRSIGAHR